MVANTTVYISFGSNFLYSAITFLSFASKIKIKTVKPTHSVYPNNIVYLEIFFITLILSKMILLPKK